MTPGLDAASKLEPGDGWVAADVQVESDIPLAVSIEGGMKLTPDWSAYADAWVQPTVGVFGGDVGARFKEDLDLYAGGWGDTQGNWGASAGVKLRF